MGHPHVHWTLDAGPLAAMAFGSLVYVRRFRAARAEAGGRGARPLQAVALGCALLALLAAMQPILYIFAAKVGLAALGIYLAWSTSVAYDYYNHVPRIWGLSAVEDQNAGGAIMLVEQSLVLVTVMSVLFVRMLAQSEEEELRRERLEDIAAAGM